MSRIRFDQELLELQQGLTSMASLIEESLTCSLALVERNDKAAVEKIFESTQRVRELERQIERQCLLLLLYQQPIASDLRRVSSALKIITHLRRISEQSANIAELVREIMPCDVGYRIDYIGEMGDVVRKMVHRTIQAFVRQQLDAATNAIIMDDIIDDLFVKVRQELVEYIKKEPTNAEEALDLFMIAKYLEKIGDHAASMANWVIFSITGERRKNVGNEKIEIR